MTIFCEGIKNDKRQVFLIMSLILYTSVVIIINNFYRGETMEKKKSILLLPLSLSLSFHFVATKRRLSFSFLFFVVDVCIRLIIASSFSKRFLFEKAHSLLNAAGRDGFPFGERKIP